MRTANVDKELNRRDRR